MKLSFYILSLLVLLTSCKKDVVPEESVSTQVTDCDCTPIPEIQGPNTGYTYLEDSVYVFFPQYNPNNSEEILYCNFNGSGGIEMSKYNLVSQQKNTLYSGSMTYLPNWGKGDWILFDKGDGQIWKMKSNGDSLSLATSGGAFFHPKWNDSGESFMTYHGGVDNSTHYNGKIWNLSGGIVDSVDIVYGNGDWRLQDNFGYLAGSSIKVFDMTNKTIIGALNSNPILNFTGFNWLGEDKAIVTSTDGIYLYEVSSNSLSLIRCTCNSQLFIQATVNGDGTKVLFTRSTLTPVNGFTLRERRELVQMSTTDFSFSTLVLP